MGCLQSGAPASQADEKTGGEEKKDITSKYALGATIDDSGVYKVVEATINNEPITTDSELDDSNSKVAIKILSKKKIIHKKIYQNEVDILAKLKHKNIIRFVDNTYYYYIFITHIDISLKSL